MNGLSEEQRAEKIDEFLVQVAMGRSLRSACRSLGLATSSIMLMIGRDEELRARYIEAKRVGMLMLFDQIPDLFEDLDRDLRDPKYDPKDKACMVMKTRSEVDTLKWALSKMMPKLFGDQAELPGGNRATLVIDLKPEGQDE